MNGLNNETSGTRRGGHSTVWTTHLRRCVPVPIYGSSDMRFPQIFSDGSDSTSHRSSRPREWISNRNVRISHHSGVVLGRAMKHLLVCVSRYLSLHPLDGVRPFQHGIGLGDPVRAGSRPVQRESRRNCLEIEAKLVHRRQERPHRPPRHGTVRCEAHGRQSD